MKCYEVVENEKQMVILMEWLRGGHLLDTLEEMAGQHYSEQQAAILFVQARTLPALVTRGHMRSQARTAGAGCVNRRW